jgi:hypothetical protein
MAAPKAGNPHHAGTPAGASKCSHDAEGAKKKTPPAMEAMASTLASVRIGLHAAANGDAQAIDRGKEQDDRHAIAFIKAEFIGISAERNVAKAAPKLAMEPVEPIIRRIQPNRNAGQVAVGGAQIDIFTARVREHRA